MRQTYLFSPIILTDINTVWEQFLHLGVPVSFPVRSFISASGAPSSESASGMYYIRRGRVRLSSLNISGQEKVMLYMGRGVLFNEIPMLQFSHDYVFTCMEDTETVFLSKKLLTDKFIKEYPPLFLNLLESMSKKSQNFYSQLSALRSFSSFANVCRTLYSMHLFQRVRGNIVPQLTQQELAAFLGIHRSSLHKALTRLKEEGTIGPYSRKHLALLDEKALYEHALKTEEE